jgi:hypothetical protein
LKLESALRPVALFDPPDMRPRDDRILVDQRSLSRCQPISLPLTRQCGNVVAQLWHGESALTLGAAVAPRTPSKDVL